MGLSIVRAPSPPSEAIADRRLYVVADRSRVVEEGHHTAAYLLAAAGSPISATDMARFGLTVADGVIVLRGRAPAVVEVPVPEPVLADEPVEDADDGADVAEEPVVVTEPSEPKSKGRKRRR